MAACCSEKLRFCSLKEVVGGGRLNREREKQTERQDRRREIGRRRERAHTKAIADRSSDRQH